MYQNQYSKTSPLFDLVIIIFNFLVVFQVINFEIFKFNYEYFNFIIILSMLYIFIVLVKNNVSLFIESVFVSSTFYYINV